MVERCARVERRVAYWTQWVAVLGVFALLVIAGTTVLDVLLRWLFNAPIKGLNDINSLAAPVVVAACLPLVLATRQNIVIRFLGDALGAPRARWLDALGSLLLLGFVALVAWQLVVYTIELARSSRTTWELLIPVTPSWAVACFIVILCIPVQCAALVTDMACALSGVERPREEVQGAV